MEQHLKRLLRAAAWGGSLAVLAGCGGNASTDESSGGTAGAGGSSGSSGGSAGSAGTSASGGTGAVVDAGADSGFDAGNLEPYPTELSCFGPEYDGGYYGQCCEQVVCGSPDAGTCPAPADIGYDFPGLPPGSGSCECGERSGPYASRLPSEGPCCYVVGSIACEGRPLIVDGAPRLAPIVHRLDWSWV